MVAWRGTAKGVSAPAPDQIVAGKNRRIIAVDILVEIPLGLPLRRGTVDGRGLKSRGVGGLHIDHHRLGHEGPFVAVVVAGARNRIDGIVVVGLGGVGDTAHEDLPQLALQIVDFLDQRGKELLVDVQYALGVEAVSKILAEQDEETAEVDEAEVVGGMIFIADHQPPEVA